MKISRKWFLGLFAFILVPAVLACCSSSGLSPQAATPAAPTGVTVTAGAGQLTITWTAVAGATSYNLYWSTTAGVTTANGTKVTSVTSPYNLTGLTNGTPYYLVVTAVYASGESAASAQASATAGVVVVPLPALSGTWSGTWVDTRYNVSGAITAVLTQNGTTFSGTGTIDLTALGIGIQSGTASGTISGNNITFTFNAAGVGSGTGSLTGTGGSGSGVVAGALNFGAFNFTGTASDILISGTFNFTSPTGGNGTIIVNKQ